MTPNVEQCISFHAWLLTDSPLWQHMYHECLHRSCIKCNVCDFQKHVVVSCLLILLCNLGMVSVWHGCGWHHILKKDLYRSYHLVHLRLRQNQLITVDIFAFNDTSTNCNINKMNSWPFTCCKSDAWSKLLKLCFFNYLGFVMLYGQSFWMASKSKHVLTHYKLNSKLT